MVRSFRRPPSAAKPRTLSKKLRKDLRRLAGFSSVRWLPAPVAGVALAVSATSAFAFDGVLAGPKGLHVKPYHHSAAIEALHASATPCRESRFR